MMFFSLFSTALSSVLYGALATVVLMALLYVLLVALDKRKVGTPVFFATGVVLALLLVAQFSMVFGALEVKSTVDSVEEIAVQTMATVNGTLDGTEADSLMETLTDQYPVVGEYMEKSGLDVGTAGLTAAVLVQEIQDAISSYIWRRVGWMAAFTVVACFVVLIAPGKNRQSYTASYDDDSSSVGDTDEWGL